MLDRLRRRLDPARHAPLLPPTPSLSGLARRVARRDLADLAERAQLPDLGHGFDAFGLTRTGVLSGLVITAPLYDTWFRVSSYGAEQLPERGGAVLACNHSGTLPMDAMMVWNDVIRHSPGNRVLRIIMDNFVPGLPAVNTLFARAGGVGGSRGNFHAILASGQLLLVFPEGVPGIGKAFKDRYQLQKWREGHVELAIRHGVPVVPVAVVGAEEQMPQLTRIEGIKAFGAPYLPVPATPFPLPVHYHVHYGEPLPVHERWRPAQAQDPFVVSEAANWVKGTVQDLLDRGVAARPGIFR